MKVENIILSMQKEKSENIEKLLNMIKKRKQNLIIVSQGDRISIEENLWMDILWPNSQKLISENALNNNSIVCKLNYQNFSALFTGDIEKLAEDKLLEEYQENKSVLSATVLKVAHHGSKTSSTKEWIKAVNPKIALIGVGENNHFGHPNGEVIERLKYHGVQVYRTDIHGEIVLCPKEKSLKVNLVRNFFP